MAIPDFSIEAKSIPLFNGLTPEQVDSLAGRMQIASFAAGTPVLTARQNGSVIYFIREGTVKICSQRGNGREVIITIVGAGDTLGEIHSTDGKGHSASAVTLEHCSMWHMDSQAFHRFRHEVPLLTDNLLCLVTKRARFMTERLHTLAVKSVSGRFAALILNFAESHGQVLQNSDIVIGLTLRQTDIAALIGASRQYTSETIGSFVDRGYLSYNDDRHLVIHNREGLLRHERED